MRSFKMSIAIASTLAMLLLTLTSAQAASPTAQERAAKRVEEPERHFHEASKYFAQNDNQNAAREIRSGAAYLKREADRRKPRTGPGFRPLRWNSTHWQRRLRRARSPPPMNSTRPLPAPTSRWRAIAISWQKRRSHRATTSRLVAGSKLPPITSRTPRLVEAKTGHRRIGNLARRARAGPKSQSRNLLERRRSKEGG